MHNVNSVPHILNTKISHDWLFDWSHDQIELPGQEIKAKLFVRLHDQVDLYFGS